MREEVRKEKRPEKEVRPVADEEISALRIQYLQKGLKHEEEKEE